MRILPFLPVGAMLVIAAAAVQSAAAAVETARINSRAALDRPNKFRIDLPLITEACSQRSKTSPHA
jgi:hypothetical protein